MRVPRMNDSLASSIAFWLASETTVTSSSWWVAMKDRITGSMVLVSAWLPSNASTISGNPAASVNRSKMIWGSRRRSLENPGLRNPSAVGFKAADTMLSRARRSEWKSSAGSIPSTSR